MVLAKRVWGTLILKEGPIAEKETSVYNSHVTMEILHTAEQISSGGSFIMWKLFTDKDMMYWAWESKECGDIQQTTALSYKGKTACRPELGHILQECR